MVTLKHHHIYSAKPLYQVLMGFCLFLVIAGSLINCSSTRFKIPPSVPDDRRPVPQPRPRKINLARDVFEKQFFDQLQQFLDISRHYRKISGDNKQAYNVNAFDEVANSSWFTNRNHVRQLSLEEIARGPNTGYPGPDTSGAWTITRVKVEGVTPGFTIRDKHGVSYLIKFEPPGYTEMVSGAEVVSTKLFYAAGYNVPQNYIVYFHPNILELSDNVKIIEDLGRERYMTDADLEEILNRIDILPDGRIRAAASKLIKGNAFLGPFYYKGIRNDDLNDVIPHQHRRELRGLRVIAAWLNHFDTKANNTLDVYVEDGYVRHYLIDFGSTLGSNGDEPMPPYVGNENSFDPHRIGLNTASLGFYVPPWQRRWHIKYPSVGYYTSEGFEPQAYKFIMPNPAFELMTSRDGFWGAKIVMSFSDEQIRAAVAQGEYSKPEAAKYLARTIMERRDIVGRYWFDKMCPLDKFEIKQNSRGRQELSFVDLVVKTGLESFADTQYRYDLRVGEKKIFESRQPHSKKYIPLPDAKEILYQYEISPENMAQKVQWEFKIQAKRGAEEEWSKWVKVFLTYHQSVDEFQLIGILRDF